MLLQLVKMIQAGQDCFSWFRICKLVQMPLLPSLKPVVVVSHLVSCWCVCVCVCVCLQVRAKLAMLNKQWPVAENLLLSQGKVDECIAMYQGFHK